MDDYEYNHEAVNFLILAKVTQINRKTNRNKHSSAVNFLIFSFSQRSLKNKHSSNEYNHEAVNDSLILAKVTQTNRNKHKLIQSLM